MPKLTIVRSSEPTEKEKLTLRRKKIPKPDGMIQCNRCGGRTILNTVTGSFIKNGRKQGGTKCDKDVCYDCHMQGIFSPMLPTFKIAKKKK